MAEGLEETQACWNADKAVESLLARLNLNKYQMYLTGENNFRYQIFPEYKLSRRTVARPTHLQAVKDHLVRYYNAVISDGCEADDLCGADQCESNSQGEDTILVHIDKDLNMIPGLHFSPEIMRKGIVVREERRYFVSPNEAIKFFYTQLLTGDSTDGIKGAAGIGKVKAEKILRDITDETELLETVRGYFSCDEELILNGQCLWIWRKQNDIWNLPEVNETSKC